MTLPRRRVRSNVTDDSVAVMGTARGFDRLIFFTDAVTAIAITLLILPLVDLVPEYSSRSGATVGGFLTTFSTEILAFVLSFVIIARLWRANHSTLEQVERQSSMLINLDLAWAFTVVVLPLPTALISSALTTDRSAIAFYIGTMTASSLLLTAMSWEVYRKPELGSSDRQSALRNLYGVGSTSAFFLIALALALIFPQTHFWFLLLLLLTIPLDRIIEPRLRAPRTAPAPTSVRNADDTPRG